MCIYTCIIIMDDPQLQWRLLSISITVPITLPMLLLSMFFPWKGVLFNYISSRRRRSLRAPHYRRANQMAQLGAEAGDQGRRPARPPPPGRWWPCAPGGGPPALGSGSGPAASSLQTRQSAVCPRCHGGAADGFGGGRWLPWRGWRRRACSLSGSPQWAGTQ